MAVYQEMDQDELEAILKAYSGEDILGSEKKKEDAFLRQFSCPRCEGHTQPVFSSVSTIFVPGSLLPQHNLRCVACGCEFNPRNGVIYKLGNLGKAIESAMAHQTPWITGSDDEPLLLWGRKQPVD